MAPFILPPRPNPMHLGLAVAAFLLLLAGALFLFLAALLPP
ncbi:hypothetical protein [Thermus sp. 2.9]|nr:hypothetical protein [Thermus sp. 2.9]